MMIGKHSWWASALLVLVAAAMVLSACGQPEVQVEKEVARSRTGAWVDGVVAVEEPSADAAVVRLESGDIDIYAYTVSNPEVLAKVEASPNLQYAQSFGSYNELTFNTAGPVFEGTGKLNPLGVPRVREAMNWLIDREYMVNEFLGGLGAPRWLPFNGASNDYALMADVARRLELEYAYDKELAAEVIGEEMVALGAELVGGKWQYEGEPVDINILIRTEDERREVGDYVGSQLEDIGFTVTRSYGTSAELSPLWAQGDPNAGEWNIYTGGWITTVVPRDLGDNFSFFYTDMGIPWPLFQNYENDPEFYDLAQKLENRAYTTLEERRELTARAMELSLKESQRIWLWDQASIAPYRNDVQVAADLYGSISGSWLWAFTVQRVGQVGGTVTVAMPSILTEPWNAIAGSNWIYDMMMVRSTGEMGYMPDPYTGLYRAQRAERAEVTVLEGFPVVKTLDWVDLNFAEEIVVPDDAWADWDPVEQRFITAGEKYTETQTVARKSVVYYPEDLYETVTWHDGSSFSIADVLMGMILTFDRAQEDSPYYDAAAVATYNSFMSAFRGVKILSTDPLIIETYSNLWNLDAELNVTFWWPYFDQGQGSWHALTLGLMAEDAGEAAFSASKADELEVEWLSYIAGPTISILKGQLDAALAESFVPYAPTMGDYLTAAEAKARYENLKAWYDQYGHFWVGTGPLYLERAYTVEKTVSLKRNAEFPDLSEKWTGFAEPMLADVFLDGPDRVTIGSEAIYDVFVDFEGDPYPMRDIDGVSYLVFDATGELAAVGAATAVDDGLWEVVLGADLTSQLAAGSNRLEVVVVSKRVAVPSTDALIFVTQ
jgi:peptide/nickel transport system substrate-binding protein